MVLSFVTTLVFVIACILSSFLNSLIVYVILATPNLRKDPKMLLHLFLATSDFLVSLLSIPYSLMLLLTFSTAEPGNLPRSHHTQCNNTIFDPPANPVPLQ